MIRISSVERAEAAVTHIEVVFSLSPAQATSPKFLTRLYPDTWTLKDCIWAMRNHWVQAEAEEEATAEADAKHLLGGF